jgi:NADH dehydrogenase
MILVVGATGVLGTEICRLLREKGKNVRGLARTTSAPEKKQRLKDLGVELVDGDLKDAASLENACKGVDSIVSTATSIVSRQDDDSLITTDRDGHLSLIDAAEKAGVKRFVFISFPPIPFDFPLQTAKRDVEARLEKGGMAYTILQPTLFHEIWLGPHLGFDAANKTVRIYGEGKNKISWISFRDVAKFAVLSLETNQAENRKIPLGGPEPLSPLEVVQIFEDVWGEKFKVEFVPEAALRAQYEAATEPIPRTFTALMLSYATGGAVDMRDVLQWMPVQLRSIRDYAQDVRSQTRS